MKRLLWVFVASGLLAGCAIRYSYDDTAYGSAAQALAAARKDIAANVASVKPVARPVGGRLKLVIPDRRLLREAGLHKSRAAAPEAIRSVVDFLQIGMRANADILRKSRLFDSVRLAEAYETQDPPIGTFDYLLWFYLESPSFSRWYMKRARSVERTTVAFDDREKDGPRRAKKFVDAVVRALDELAPAR